VSAPLIPRILSITNYSPPPFSSNCAIILGLHFWHCSCTWGHNLPMASGIWHLYCVIFALFFLLQTCASYLHASRLEKITFCCVVHHHFPRSPCLLILDNTTTIREGGGRLGLRWPPINGQTQQEPKPKVGFEVKRGGVGEEMWTGGTRGGLCSKIIGQVPNYTTKIEKDGRTIGLRWLPFKRGTQQSNISGRGSARGLVSLNRASN
jgi:hypothetical protein